MISIIEKLEAITVTSASFLSQADIQFCDEVFIEYKRHINFWTKQLETLDSPFTLYEQKKPSYQEPFYYDILPLLNLPEQVQKLIRTLTQSLVFAIENYFKSSLQLQFEALDILASQNGVVPLETYLPIIDNIVDQIGTDIAESALRQIRERLQSVFTIERKKPQLKTKGISLPRFFYFNDRYGTPTHPYRDSDLIKLLHGINAFLHNSTKLTDELQNSYDGWTSDVLFNHSYLLSGFTITFFKNGRVDIYFIQAENNERFYQSLTAKNQ